MKVFATLATILGIAYATPVARTYTPNQVGSVRSGLQQQNIVMPSQTMSNIRMASPYQAQAGPTQYHLQDEFGNFEYAYANKDSEKMERGNNMSVKGRYAYIMSDGVLRRVDYIADNNGFHVLQDNADNSRSQDRIKRSVDPDLIQTRMTSFMDSSALRDNSMVNPNVYNMMGGDMSSNMMQRNGMNQISSQQNMYGMMDRSFNTMDKHFRDNNVMGRNKMDENTMGKMMDDNVMGGKMISQNMYSNMMGRDMSSNTMNPNMIGQQRMSNMGNRNIMGQEMMGRKTTSNNVYSNVMGRDMSSSVNNHNSQYMLNRNMMGLSSNIMGQEMSSNTMGRDMSSNMMNTYVNDINRLPLGQRNTMSQRMQIEQIPQPIASRNPLF